MTDNVNYVTRKPAASDDRLRLLLLKNDINKCRRMDVYGAEGD